jgi:hypothetical protein
MPVMARPRIRPGIISAEGNNEYQWQLTVNITLSFISLGNKQISYMSSDAILIADGITTKDLL